MKIKAWLIRIIDKIHYYLFKEEMSSAMKNFLLNLSYITVSSVIAAALMMIIQIVAGRFMGPSEFGKFSLTLSIGSILSTLSLLGLHVSSIYYISKEQRKAQFITGSLVSSIFNTFIISLIWFLLLNFWGKIFKIDHSIAIYSGIFMIFNTLYHVSRSYLRGLDKMKQFAIYDVISALISIAVFIPLILLTNEKSFILAIIARIIMLCTFFILVIYLIYPYLRRFNLKDLKYLYGYGLFSFYAGIGNLILGNADRIMINYYKGPHDAGLYYAYFLASQAVVFQLYQSFLIIFFPAATQSPNKSNLLLKINKLVIKLLVPLFLVNIASTALFVWLFGKNYPFNWPLIFFFSVYSLLYIIFQTYGWLLNTTGKKGARDNAVYIIIGAILFIFISLYTIPHWGITGTIISLTISNLFLTVAMIKRAHLLLNKGIEEPPI